MTLGVLVFLFVGYQLWGTGLTEQREQKALAAQFKQQMVTSPVPPGDTVPTTSGSNESGDVPTLSTPAPATLPANGAGAELGDAIAQLEIPSSTSTSSSSKESAWRMKKGPGHYPGTALPGGSGNAAIAGHRTAYGAPFFRLDELEAGDPIFITTRGGRYRYDVSELKIVAPEDAWVPEPTEDNRSPSRRATPATAPPNDSSSWHSSSARPPRPHRWPHLWLPTRPNRPLAS